MTRFFATRDARYRVELGEEVYRRLLDLCGGGWPEETGGVLVGYYTPQRDTAVVTAVEPPPPDSRRGRTWFERGVEGLRELFRELWKRAGSSRRYYLGEWHLHPRGAPWPSSTDRRQMQEIADGPYECPETVLILVGGQPPEAWEVGVWVFRRRQRELRLEPGAGVGSGQATGRTRAASISVPGRRSPTVVPKEAHPNQKHPTISPKMVSNTTEGDR